MKIDGEDNVADSPIADENRWFSYAVICGMFTIATTAMAAVWVFSENDPEIRSKMSSTLVPFGTLMIGAVTFCTVAWRGLVGSRQADQQRRQNDATDDANYAKLLQEGAKLVADNKPPNQLAGIASLSILINEPKARYAPEALDVLAEGIKSLFHEGFSPNDLQAVSKSSVFSSIQTLLAAEAAAGRFSRVSIELEPTGQWPAFESWPHIKGFHRLRITGGRLERAEEVFSGNQTVDIRKSQIVNSECAFTWSVYTSCDFISCHITRFEDLVFLGDESTFTKCDFSGCVFEDGITVTALNDASFKNCWYDAELPPNLRMTEEFLVVLEPKIKVKNRWFSLTGIDADNPNLTASQRDIVLSNTIGAQ
ncbi:hypothetical protein ABUK73_06315 [Agrobacterium sp. BA1120]|uniref:hypothetical protein n=1 Tax=Agrobacterium sp. BA1120 TaxID=3228927 RepID=UPI00336AB6DA